MGDVVFLELKCFRKFLMLFIIMLCVVFLVILCVLGILSLLVISMCLCLVFLWVVFSFLMSWLV